MNMKTNWITFTISTTANHLTFFFSIWYKIVSPSFSCLVIAWHLTCITTFDILTFFQIHITAASITGQNSDILIKIRPHIRLTITKVTGTGVGNFCLAQFFSVSPLVDNFFLQLFCVWSLNQNIKSELLPDSENCKFGLQVIIFI